MSMKKDKPIKQDSDSFAELAQILVSITKIKQFSDEEIAIIKRLTYLETQLL